MSAHILKIFMNIFMWFRHKHMKTNGKEMVLMRKIVVGIFAHVDAGKTTLSENMLYLSGAIRNAGRVDNGDTSLDTYAMERQRGITIFSKQAEIKWNDLKITLLDTPGHVDFSAEMERTLSVIDYAVLLISAPDSVQAHTETLWKLLKRYGKPVFIFVNKMDRSIADKNVIMKEIKKKLSDACIDFTSLDRETMENIAMCDEKIMEYFLENDCVTDEMISEAVKDRKVYPCYFGSALKMEGIEAFLDGFVRYAREEVYGNEFGAKVYKISRDTANNRLTHMKITGGNLRVKDYIEKYDEKINQIRIYSGERFIPVNEVSAGDVCVVTGLSKTCAGEGIGAEGQNETRLLEPVMTYSLVTDDDVNNSEVFKRIREIEEEMPELTVQCDEKTGNIQVKIMGEVQIEVLKNLIKDRFDLNVSFGTGNIVYKETIQNIVEGVGHFEPLKHYAEVHLILKPGERGSGIQIYSECSEDELAKNWQRLILTHIEEKMHVGVLTGSRITDIQIILAGGRAHNKHTEGGDFRQATYRAVRQGLMQAESVLLEPYYDFKLRVPTQMVGRAMTDLEKMGANFGVPENNGDMAEISGDAPVSSMQNYAMDVNAYTRGNGRLSCSFKGYYECHNADEVIDRIGYDVYSDMDNTPDSVFCAHGAGYVVPWHEVKDYMHIESKLADNGCKDDENMHKDMRNVYMAENTVKREDKRSGYEKDRELEEIFLRTFGSKSAETKKDRIKLLHKTVKSPGYSTDKPYVYKPRKRQEQYLLVDGYNIIFSWEELRELANVNMDGARDRLLDILSNYQGYKNINVMAVFDAYKIKGFSGEMSMYNNVCVVYTKEAETADQYIEKFAHNNSRKYDVTVATSDGLEQIIITGEGCHLMSAREFKAEIDMVNEHIRNTYLS